ncbi:hypothetical protein LPJ53_002410 [Coemansia erecta]|uniref:Glycoside hydrolase family 19 catalytic domain-containing protein n=1 Tax=Coemansia erecta TaxID=147472 RepID=A0A9W7Y231_9FUNG|nr:hypothetical protein LPJ53_002410 [Coemansia erecta]
MVLFTNVASLLVAMLAAGSQVARAIPQPQDAAAGTTDVAAADNTDAAAATSSAVEATDAQGNTENAQAGDACDSTKDRIVCDTDHSMLFCSNNEWVQFSNCTTGTVCKDGMCVFPESESAGDEAAAATPASSEPAGDQTDAAADTAADEQQESPASDDQAAAETTQDETNQDQSSSPVAEASSSAPAESSEGGDDSSSSDGGGGGGGSSGDNYGITCDKFSEAVTKAGDAIGQKYPAPSDAQCQSFLKGMPEGDIASAREAAMFLANILWESDGLQAKEEYSCQEMPDWCAEQYVTPEDVEGQTYWGRGYIQLTWHYNYADASEGLYGDDRLATDTAQVASNEDIAWAVSFWFWKDRVRSDSGVQEGNFGASINKINGGLECNGGGAADKAKKRYEMYKVVLPIFDSNESPKESGCYN